MALPSVANAPLPVVYTQARRALAECWRVDECKEWANKAEALASYARQSKDEGLYQVALRIQTRAIRRCGELLREMEPSKGGQPTHGGGGMSRNKAAKEAGLSERQKHTALRVASVPEPEFEAQVESDAPPTVTALAAQGTQSKPAPTFDLEGIDPEDFQAATHVIGTVHEFCRHTDNVDFQQAARGLKVKERPELCRQIALARTRLTALEEALCTVTQV